MTQNTETLKLYKNSKLYNGSRYQYLLTGTQESAYQQFENWLGTPDYSKTVYYKSISEPILINEYIKNCDEYTYGSITNEGKTYYFFVDSITTDAYKQTTINYTIDWWTTNWFSINCTIAHITRQNITKPMYMEQPYSPQYTYAENESITTDYCFMATYIPSSEHGTSYISTLILDGNNETFNLINNGQWYNVLGIPGADIKDSFVVPFFTVDYIKSKVQYNTIYLVSKEDSLSAVLGNFIDRYPLLVPFSSDAYYWLYCIENGKWYTLTYDSTEPLIVGIKANVVEGQLTNGSHPYRRTLYNEYYAKLESDIKIRYLQDNSLVEIGNQLIIYNSQLPEISRDLTKTFASTEYCRHGIIDWNGEMIWECPYGVTINKFKVTLLKGLSHVILQFIPYDSNDDTYQSNLLTDLGFCYDCKHPGLFVDSYQDYVLKNREYDIQMRRIQSEKQEIQAWANVAENIGFGYAFGGAGTGSMRGAQAAGIGGIIEATTTTALNFIYDPQIQNQYDKRYQRMTDQITIIGDSIWNVMFENILSKYYLYMDNSTLAIMNKDITINGYYSNETTDDLQSKFNNGRIIQADNVVVEGACNVIGKQQVVRRLMNGVEFISDSTPLPVGSQNYTITNITNNHTLNATFEQINE